MPLLSLPPESVLCIVGHLEQTRDILAIVMTSHRLLQIALRILYRFNVQHQNSSALHWWAQKGVAEMVEILVRLYPGGVNAVYEDKTPLISAVLHGSESVVEILLRAGASINFFGRNGITPLWYAASDGHIHIVDQLLAREDIEINRPGKHGGTTPLAMAAFNGHERIVMRLAATGQADINTRCAQNWTPLLRAICLKQHHVVECLLSMGDIEIECRDLNGQTPLHHAATHSHLPTMRRLLQKGANMNAIDSKRQTPLDMAIVSGDAVIVKDLNQAELDPLYCLRPGQNLPLYLKG